MNQPILSVSGLSKFYRVYPRPVDRVLELASRRSRHQEIRALDDVTFGLQKGESLGVIGQNGSGKSTLLRVLTGVTTPTRGEVSVNAKVASLLELGMGFHFEFTGRQNIAINAAIMGLSPDDVEEKTPEIIAFSELGEFIDRPVKTYSTGMKMRLGFSIAINVEPEILIIDEALSVGDGYFQKKCMDRILRYVGSGRTLLFCSHAMYYVSTLCQRALWLRDGRVAALGPVDEVVRQYDNFLVAKSEGLAAEMPDPADEPAGEPAAKGLSVVEISTGESPLRSRAPVARAADDEGGQPARILEVRQLGEHGETKVFRHREPWMVEIEWAAADPSLAFHVAFGIDRADGVQICSFGTHADGLPPVSGRRRYRVRLLIPEWPVLQGEFSLYAFLLDEQGLHVYDQALLHPGFEVESPSYRIGLITAEHRWDFDVLDTSAPTTEAGNSVEAQKRQPAEIGVSGN